MSQLFDKFTDQYVDIPNNQFRFLPPLTGYKDVLVLGVNNQHTFRLPYEFSELRKLEITYIQGTEVKLVKTFYMDKFVPENDFNRWDMPDNPETEDIDESINPNEGIVIYTYLPGGAKLFQLDKNWVNAQLEMLKPNDELPTYCILYYDISPEETMAFNGYNKQVYTQMKLWVDINNDSSQEEKIEFSKKYKIKIEESLDAYAESEPDISVKTGSHYKEVD